LIVLTLNMSGKLSRRFHAIAQFVGQSIVGVKVDPINERCMLRSRQPHRNISFTLATGLPCANRAQFQYCCNAACSLD